MSSEDEKRSPEEEPLKKDESNTKRDEKKTFCEKLTFLKSNITVEPIFAGLVIASTVSRLAIQNLNLDKACRVKLRLGDEICDSVINKRENSSYYEGETQKVIAAIETWRSIITTAIPTILVIFMGAWSDRTGNRKVCVLLPVVGEFIASACNMLSTYFFYEIPVEATMLLESIFPALTGGWVMLYLGAFSYISDVTSEDNRTYRVGMANLCLTAGIPIGTALSGILLKLLGYFGIFIISGSVYLITFLYGVVYLEKTTKRGVPDQSEKPTPVKLTDVLSLVKETATVGLKKRSGNQRSKLIMTLLIVSIVYGPSHGERIVTYMFTRYRLKWDGLMFSMYSTYSIITHSIGALFSISVFSKRWGFHDTVLCIISITSKMVGSILHNFVTKDWHMFMVPLVEILNATTFTSLRSMASKLVENAEMGKMNSLFSLVETLAALIFDPTYSALYSRTVKTHTGAVYLFSALMTLPPLFMLTLLFLQYRRETKQKLSWNPADWCTSPQLNQYSVTPKNEDTNCEKA